MKLIWMFLLLFVVAVFAQEPPSNWGGGIEWGTALTENGLDITGIETAINGSDTLWTAALPIQGNTDGVYSIKAFWEAVDAASDSVELEARYGVRMTKARDDLVVKWTDWKGIFRLKSTGTLYDIYISRSDSSWWTPYNFRQYRTYRRDAVDVDTCTVYITDFVR